MSRTDLLVLAGEHMESLRESYYDQVGSDDEDEEGDEYSAPIPACAPCARSFTVSPPPSPTARTHARTDLRNVPH